MLTLLLTILILLLGLLAIPVGLDYQVNWRGKLQGEIYLSWLFGLLRVRIPIDKSQAHNATKAARSKPRSRAKLKPLAVWRQRSFRRRILRFLRNLWQTIHKHNVRVQFRIGLGDPADTGQLWSLMGPISAMLAQLREIQCNIEPDFMDQLLEINSSGQVRIIPLQLLGLSLALFLSPGFWQGLRHLRTAG